MPLLRPLADLVDRAAYAEEQIPDDAAAYAWHYTDTIRTELRATQSRGGRLRNLLTPGPLLR